MDIIGLKFRGSTIVGCEWNKSMQAYKIILKKGFPTWINKKTYDLITAKK
jgi:hypothetical protein